jgi:hypothetical protein
MTTLVQMKCKNDRQISAQSSSNHDCQPTAVHIPSTGDRRTLRIRLVRIWRDIRHVNLPSMSTVLPIVLFHCFPARAILRKRTSPSADRRPSGGKLKELEFAASSVDGVGPEKKA